ncbi:helix-turn-helix transcriptional regulator [Fructobacillus cardui]
MLIGEKIKMIRESEKMTQEQLGEQLHLTRQTISNWENGKSYPGIAEIVAIKSV